MRTDKKTDKQTEQFTNDLCKAISSQSYILIDTLTRYKYTLSETQDGVSIILDNGEQYEVVITRMK